MRSHTGSRLGLAVRRRSQSSEEAEVQKWEHLVVPLDAAGGLKKGDLVAWPVVFLKRPVG